MTTEPCGLYIHIPFCKSKCNYCDFCSFGDAYDKYISDYIKALIKEASGYKRDEKIKVDTLYFGGGTPSLLSPARLGEILSGIMEYFEFLPNMEFTLEANPGTLTQEKAIGYKRLGVNRISIGLQSIHEKEMKKLGRIHGLADFEKSFHLLREAGFDNINVDLMYGIPEQTLRGFRETLEYVNRLSPEHISCYGLIVEEGTPFYNQRESLAFPDEDTECDMYALASLTLSGGGYSHYEISNYSKVGYESRHNLKYWRLMPYIGLGLAAHSYFDGRHYGNTRDISDYISGSYREDEELLSQDDEMFEYAMMRLRLNEGISLSEYEARFKTSFLDGKEEKVKFYEDCGLLCRSGERIYLTERGFYLSNTVLSGIL